MKNPQISVLMPVYNGEEYLREAIDSILAQTYPNFEFLIIDDGSTDSSVNIIKSYTDERIRLIQNDKNLRLPASLNRGIKEATGTYIARMDCDDISLPTRFERQVDFMEAHPEIGACGTNGKSIDEHGKFIRDCPWWQPDSVPLEWLLFWETTFTHPTMFIRREALEAKNVYYRNLFAEDRDLWCRMALITKFARLSEVLLYYRERDSGSYNSARNKHLAQAISSGEELVTAVTGEAAPAYYSQLTVYPCTMGEGAIFYNVDEVITWSKRLLQCSAQKWDWTDEEIKMASQDLRIRLNQYYSNFFGEINIFDLLKINRIGGVSSTQSEYKTIFRYLYHVSGVFRAIIDLYHDIRKH